MDNKGKLKVDIKKILREQFCVAIAVKEITHTEIDKIFNKNKIIYLKAYQKSEYYKSRTFTSYDYKTEKYAQKVMGILAYYLVSKDVVCKNALFQLYKLAYRRVYNRIKNLNNVNIENFLAILSSDFYGNYEFVASVFVAKELEEEFPLNNILIETATLGIITDMDMTNIYKQQNFNPSVINSYKEDIISIKKELGIKNKTYSLFELINDIEDNEIEKVKIEKNMYGLNNHSIEKIGRVSKHIGCLEGLIKYLNVSGISLAINISFSSQEIDELIVSHIYAEKFNSYSRETEVYFDIVYFIYIAAILKEYVSLKTTYMKETNEEHLVSIDKKEKLLNKQKESLIEAKQKIKDYENKYKNEKQELLQEIERLKKENLTLKLDMDELKDIKSEVVTLRNFVFDESLDDNEHDVINSNSYNIDEISSLKVAIVGGSAKWQANIKELLPDYTYILTKDKNMDLNFLKNVDFILINTKTSHSFVFKIMSIVNKYKIKFNYLKSSTNINLSLSDIYDKVLANVGEKS